MPLFEVINVSIKNNNNKKKKEQPTSLTQNVHEIFGPLFFGKRTQAVASEVKGGTFQWPRVKSAT